MAAQPLAGIFFPGFAGGDIQVDYVLYRQSVYAAANGVIVEAADDFPEKATVPPASPPAIRSW